MYITIAYLIVNAGTWFRSGAAKNVGVAKIAGAADLDIEPPVKSLSGLLGVSKQWCEPQCGLRQEGILFQILN